MRNLISFAFVITVLSAALAPQDGADNVTRTEVTNPLAGPLHPQLLKFFGEPEIEEPALAVPGLVPDTEAVDPAPATIHL